MFPPQQSLAIDLTALSGICGSISIACWVVVFSPQIIENFRRSSAEGLSVAFIVIWLAGDIFNILGAILQGVLPTMIILAIYYTLADIVLILQVFYYRGFTLSDAAQSKPATTTNGHIESQSTETQPLLSPPTSLDRPRRDSALTHLRQNLQAIDGSHYSPATPIHDQPKPSTSTMTTPKPTSTLQKALFNTTAIALVVASGIFGWWISTRTSHHSHHHSTHQPKHPHHYTEVLQYDTLGQLFGYLCAVLYLGSRVPQLLLNYRRKSTEGVSLLFFLFACIGNLTYDMSIFAYDPTPLCSESGRVGVCGAGEAGRIYQHYIAVNASWIAGSLGTLFLDMAIFVQFFMYQKEEEAAQEEAVVS